MSSECCSWSNSWEGLKKKIKSTWLKTYDVESQTESVFLVKGLVRSLTWDGKAAESNSENQETNSNNFGVRVSHH